MDVEQHWNSFSTADADEAHRFLSAAYVDLKVNSVHGARDFRFSAGAGHLGDVLIGRVRYSAGARLLTAPSSDLNIVHVHAGLYELAGRNGYAPPPGGMALVPPDQAVDGRIENYDLTVVRLPRSLVEEVAETATGLPPAGLRFDSPRPLSPRAEQHWLRTVAYANALTGAVPDLIGSGPGRLVLAQTRQMLATALLAAFPSTALRTDPARGGRVEPAALRRAMAYIEEKAGLDLPLTQVARAAGLSPRALQGAFRRYRDTTVSEFVRRVRLERAHHALLAADPGAGVTVERISQQWGFAHAGRFARYYREAFGVSPRHTLQS